MPIINVNKRKIDVDICAELDQYDWVRPKWSAEKLIAASPFRDDSTPSFYVYLEDTESANAGNFGDSGATDDTFAKGGFVKLLAFLRGEDEYSTVCYLEETYGIDSASYDDDITIDLSELRFGHRNKTLDESMLARYMYRHPYLERRGITEKVQRMMDIGYDRDRQAVVIPWRDGNHRLASVMYRKIVGKVFWYENGGVPLRELVYGLNNVYKQRSQVAILSEAPIDAMSTMTAGVAGIATGGASMSGRQAELIAKSPLERVIIAGDNDKAGEQFTQKAVERLSKFSGLIEAVPFKWPNDWRTSAKDLNDVLRKDGAEFKRVITEVSDLSVNVERNFEKMLVLTDMRW